MSATDGARECKQRRHTWGCSHSARKKEEEEGMKKTSPQLYERCAAYGLLSSALALRLEYSAERATDTFFQ